VLGVTDSQDLTSSCESSDHPRERNTFLIDAAMRSATSLRGHLGVDELNYRVVIGHAHSDSRAYYAYGALDEVVKALLAGTRWLGMLQKRVGDAGLAGRQDRIGGNADRLALESVRDEQNLWARKLRETLTEIVLFRATNEDAYYRLYLVCKQLEAYLGVQGDFKEFYACQSRNVDSTIRMLLADARGIMKSIDAAKVWFLRDTAVLTKQPTPGFMRSFRQKFIDALGKADPDVRIVLGPSYEQSFSMPSRSVHPNVGGPTVDTKAADIERDVGLIAILAINTVLAVHEITGIPTKGIARDLANAIAKSDGGGALRAKHAPKFEVGDIVFAYGDDPCQVIDASKSHLGYTSYHVRYLATPPLPGIDTDWFPGQYVRMLFPKSEYRDRMLETLGKAGATEEDLKPLRSMTDEECSRSLADAIAEMAKSGDLGKMLDVFRKG